MIERLRPGILTAFVAGTGTLILIIIATITTPLNSSSGTGSVASDTSSFIDPVIIAVLVRGAAQMFALILTLALAAYAGAKAYNLGDRKWSGINGAITTVGTIVAVIIYIALGLASTSGPQATPDQTTISTATSNALGTLMQVVYGAIVLAGGAGLGLAGRRRFEKNQLKILPAGTDASTLKASETTIAVEETVEAASVPATEIPTEEVKPARKAKRTKVEEKSSAEAGQDEVPAKKKRSASKSRKISDTGSDS